VEEAELDAVGILAGQMLVVVALVMEWVNLLKQMCLDAEMEV
jgi:hypothetical protein